MFPVLVGTGQRANPAMESGQEWEKTGTHVLLYFYVNPRNPLEQQSPNFLAQGTSFAEDDFSMGGWGGWMVQVVMRAMGSNWEQQMKLWSLAHRSPLAVRPGS